MKQGIRWIIISVFLAAYSLNINAVMQSTYSITSSIMTEINEWIDKDTIVFISVDDVLVRPDYKMVGFGMNPYRNFESNLIARAKKTRFAVNTLASWYAQRKLTLVEPEWKDFIQSAKDKGALVFGVCSMPMYFQDIEKLRYIELYKLGIEFSPSINDKNVLALGSMGDWLSVFYQGVLFPGPTSKAKAIENLMKESLYVPKKIVFFDARESEVRRVDQILRPFYMDFYTIIYRGITQYKPELNFEKIQFQQLYFLEQGILLDDEDVAKVMQKQQSE